MNICDYKDYVATAGAMFHVILPQLVKYYGTFLLPLCLESASEGHVVGEMTTIPPTPKETGRPTQHGHVQNGGVGL